MGACSYDEFFGRNFVPLRYENESDTFDGSNVFCTRQARLERSQSVHCASSSEPSTTSSLEVLSCSVGLGGSVVSTSSHKEARLECTGNQADTVSSIPQMMKISGVKGFANGVDSSWVCNTVEGSVFLKPTCPDLMHRRVDSDSSLTHQSPRLHGSVAPGILCRSSSTTDETSFSHLEDLLQLDSRDCLGDSGVLLMDSCFQPSDAPSFPSSESVEGWSSELLQDFPCPLRACQLMPDIDEEPLENVSHVFARWLQNNSHRFSLSDISKIRLRTSTVENGMKRLGGGKKGLLYFLKLVLTWIQTHHSERKHDEITGQAGKVAHVSGKVAVRSPARTEAESRKASQRATAAVVDVGEVVKKEDVHSYALRGTEGRSNDFSNCDMPEPTVTQRRHDGMRDADKFVPLYSDCYSNSVVSFNTNWNSLLSLNDGWTRQMTDDRSSRLFNANITTPHRVVAQTKFPLATTGSQWNDTGATGSTLQEQAYFKARTTSSKSDPNRHQTSAATTRAARLSRMERRKWSVQRSRKWLHSPLRA